MYYIIIFISLIILVKYLSNKNIITFFNNNKNYFNDFQYNVYYQYTLPLNIKDEVKYILLTFLQDINKQNENSFFLTEYDYNKIYLLSDKNNNKLYYIDLFLYNTKHFSTYRYLIKAIKNDSRIKIISMTPIYSKLKYKDYYKTKINSFEVRNKYILPLEACKKNNLNKNVWPCRKTATDWDKFGVLNTPPSTSKCKGINTSTNVQYNVPNYNPGLFTIPIENYIDRYDPVNSYKAIPNNLIVS